MLKRLFSGIDQGLVVIFLLHIALVGPLLWDKGDTKYSSDQDKYHMPAIRQIEAKFPRIDIRQDSLSAISPGYHYFLAGASKLIGTSLIPLRICNAFISFLFLAALYFFLRSTCTVVSSLLLILPLAVSNFVIKSSAWVVTDNASLALVGLSLIALFKESRIGASSRARILATVATMVRQINVWLVLPLAADAIILKRAGSSHSRFIVILSCLPACVVAYLYWRWGGLVPAVWQEKAVAISFCPIAYLLSVLALLGPCYLSLFGGDELKQVFTNRLALVGTGFGFLASIISPTTYSYEEGRWGGYFWSLVQAVPAINDRSLYFVVFSSLGGCVLAAIWLLLQKKVGSHLSSIWLLCVLSWASTFLVNRQVFHRYYEPTILLFLILAAGLICKKDQVKLTLVSRIVLGGLGFSQLSITVFTAHRFLWRSLFS